VTRDDFPDARPAAQAPLPGQSGKAGGESEIIGQDALNLVKNEVADEDSP
jgi:hypothetical protein